NMATGTGKTRVAMALIDFLRRGKIVDKVLFLTDRVALREQVYKKGFMKFFPNKNILEIKEKKDKINYKHGQELYTATIPTIVNLYNRRNKNGEFEMSVGEFDLIVIDEAHRSIFNKYKHMLEYFDAYKIGLTATPANFIDRNSYQFFNCPKNKPTVVYDFYDAVEDKVLVDFRKHVMKYQTERQKEGFNLDNITEEERYEIEKELAKKGIYDIEEFNFEGDELEKKIVNKETTHLQVAEFMDVLQKDKSGEFCKTIIFAMNIPHAERIYEEIKNLYPNKPGLADIIVTGGKTKNTQKQIVRFESKSYPRIAVSVGILDTGVDVPEVCNLVFIKPISSTIRLWQMIGRGSRCEDACEHKEWLPEGGKKYFVIYDFLHNFDDWGNLKDDDKEKPVSPLVRIFNYRVDLLNYYIKSKDDKKIKYFKKLIHKEIEDIPKDLPKVKENASIINKALDSFFWKNSAINQIEYLKKEISPFIELKSAGDPLKLSFKREIEKSMILALSKDEEGFEKSKEKLKNTINKIYSVPLPSVLQKKKQLEKALHQDFWDKYDFKKSRFLLDEIYPISNLQRSSREYPLMINVSDSMKVKENIVLYGGEFKDTTLYKEEIRKKIFELAKFNPIIHKIMNDEPLYEADIEYLEDTFKKELNLTESVVRQFYTGNLISLIRMYLKNNDIEGERKDLESKFKDFRNKHKSNFNQTQLKFLDMIEKKFLMDRKIQESDLYSGQFENIAGGIDNVFEASQINEILAFYNGLK
ncbi:MAG: DEAD/DEAH box helicase family protein, partial [Candidatus Woesearchaeota archaeon]|nr:DEAD/DEAH box helicase family protein [Candidatus Woesearchaeota archaeon]